MSIENQTIYEKETKKRTRKPWIKGEMIVDE
jgi:hypothetical protein